MTAKAQTSTSSQAVSVLVGAYNHECYVQECLDSIVSGSYPEIELIIFNDASPDGTSKAILQWQAEHPDFPTVFLDRQKNIGFTRSLNEAIAHATGEFVCIIAADDVMLPNGILDRVNYLTRNPEKLAVFADSHIVDSAGKIVADSAIEGYFRHHGMRKDLLQIDELMPYNIVFHWAVPGPVFLCRRSAFEIVGAYDENSVAEDFDMYLRLAARGKLGFCNSYVSSYRKHDQSMTSIQYDEVQHFLAEAGFKNRGSFGWICRTRLMSNWYGMRARQEVQPFRRRMLFSWHRVLLLVSWRAYLIRRRLMLRKYAKMSSPIVGG